MSGPPISIRVVEPQLIPDSLLEGHAYHTHRRYRLFDRTELLKLTRRQLYSGVCLGAFEQERLLAVVGYRAEKWDSEQLGRECVRLTGLFQEPNCPRDAIPALLKTVIGENQGREIQAQIDCEDCRTSLTLQDFGFQIVDIKMSYILTKLDAFHPPEKQRFVIRLAETSDRADIQRIAQERFPSMPARFQSDPEISQKKALELYLHWLESILDSPHHKVRVAVSRGEVVGFLSYKILESVFESTQKRIFGGGLAAVEKASRSAYVDLLCQSIQQDFDDADACEVATSLQNYEAHRVLEKLGLRLAGSVYLLRRSSSL